MPGKTSLSKDKIKILLLEKVHPNAEKYFKDHGYTQIKTYPTPLEGEELVKELQDTHILGIRSRTKLKAEILEKAPKLIAVGCFCIGTNQVDLPVAKKKGVPVFNAPYSNTRSVAELVVGEAIMLLRKIPEKNAGAHQGKWMKDYKGCFEARGKTLGILGYGHIGAQVSVMAESIGMKVVYYDMMDRLALGNARAASSMDELFAVSDVISLHLPSTPLTKGMINEKNIAKMKKGVSIINAARGDLINLPDLKKALESGQIANVAIDVYAKEPSGDSDPFECLLQGTDKALLTPHIGGSTVEAQANIALEVAEKLVKYSDNGGTAGAVNFVSMVLPQTSPPEGKRPFRFMHIHQNVPGVLTAITQVFSSRSLNISGQYLMTDGEIGYAVIDIDDLKDPSKDIREELEKIKGTIRVRHLIQ